MPAGRPRPALPGPTFADLVVGREQKAEYVDRGDLGVKTGRGLYDDYASSP
jgi:hypothetical protein